MNHGVNDSSEINVLFLKVYYLHLLKIFATFVQK